MSIKLIRIFAVCIFTLLAGVAFAQEVRTDYDHTTDFSKYKTFMWIKEPKTANPLMRDRIVEAVNAQLELKGLRLVSNNADLGISANTATKEQHTLESFYDGFPGWGWHRYWNPVTMVVDTYQVGTLVVDLFDTRAKQVKWWATASDTISEKPEKNVKKLNKAVEKMFNEFPPKSKAESN